MKITRFLKIGILLSIAIASASLVMNSCSKKIDDTKQAEDKTANHLKAAWSSCTNWEYWTTGQYLFRNNIWGSGNPGASWQCVWANSSSNWGASCGHTNNSGSVKGYPQMCVGWLSGNGFINSNRGNMGKKPSDYGTLKVYWNFTAPEYSPARYFSLIDLYYHWSSNPSGSNLPSTNIQLMTHWNDPSGWFDNSGTSNMTYKGQKTIDGITYKAWYKYPHPDGAASALVQVRPTSKTKNATHNIKAIVSWLVSLGCMNSGEYQTSIQAGWELIDGANGAGFQTNGYSVTAN
jgi:hypothetical protein